LLSPGVGCKERFKPLIRGLETIQRDARHRAEIHRHAQRRAEWGNPPRHSRSTAPWKG
jgi:hypothetical protein